MILRTCVSYLTFVARLLSSFILSPNLHSISEILSTSILILLRVFLQLRTQNIGQNIGQTIGLLKLT